MASGANAPTAHVVCIFGHKFQTPRLGLFWKKSAKKPRDICTFGKKGLDRFLR